MHIYNIGKRMSRRSVGPARPAAWGAPEPKDGPGPVVKYPLLANPHADLGWNELAALRRCRNLPRIGSGSRPALAERSPSLDWPGHFADGVRFVVAGASSAGLIVRGAG